MIQIRLFDLRDVSTVQRLSAYGRALAYEPVAGEGLNPLREAMRAYVSAGYDHTIALIRRDTSNRDQDTFGLMTLIPSRGSENPLFASLLYMAPAPHTDDQVNAWTEITAVITRTAGQGPSKITAREAPNKCPEVPPATVKLSICAAKMAAARTPIKGTVRSPSCLLVFLKAILITIAEMAQKMIETRTDKKPSGICISFVRGKAE